MKVLSYKYVLPNENGVVEDLDRQGYMTPQYMTLMMDYIKSIELKGKTAFLYAGGVLLPASEARNTKDSGKFPEGPNDSGICIRELAAYSMHKWLGSIEGKETVEYVNINGNTCASSMHSLYEAEMLLNNGFDEVLVVAEEKTSYNTRRVFDEHNIDIKLGEGCAVIHLGKASFPGDEDIVNCKWAYEYNKNPFGVTESGYTKVVSDCDVVKPHGTGTENNEAAESKVFGHMPQLRYKEKYGHTQGVSGLLEVCMVLDEDLGGRVLCVSSGLGGYYASCIVCK